MSADASERISGADEVAIHRDLEFIHSELRELPERGYALQLLLTVAARMFARWCPDEPAPVEGFVAFAGQAFAHWATVEAEKPPPERDPWDEPITRLEPPR